MIERCVILKLWMEEVWALALSQLVDRKLLSRRRARRFLERRSREMEAFLRGSGIELRSLEIELERLKRAGIEVIPITSPAYPPQLRRLSSAPPALFKMGGCDLIGRSVAIVGTRTPSSEGRRIARELSGLFCRSGFVVVSGLALGVDGEAHRGAIEVGGVTAAVLGCDLGRIYPPQHRGLARLIVSRRGALISEHFEAEPTPENLIARNRLIAGLAELLVAIEPERGAMSAARFALAQGKPVFILQRLRSRRSAIRTEDGFYLLNVYRFGSSESLFDLILRKAREKAAGSLYKRVGVW